MQAYLPLPQPVQLNDMPPRYTLPPLELLLMWALKQMFPEIHPELLDGGLGLETTGGLGGAQSLVPIAGRDSLTPRLVVLQATPAHEDEHVLLEGNRLRVCVKESPEHSELVTGIHAPQLPSRQAEQP